MSQRSVFCIAPSRARADRIVHALKEAKSANTEISVLFLDGTPAPAGAPAADPAKRAISDSATEIRGVMSWIAGIRPLVIPGVDPVIAAGPLAAALGSSTRGGLAGGLSDFGMPRQESGRYESRIAGGQILISVRTGNQEQSEQARDIFTAGGGEEIFTIVQVASSSGSLLAAQRAARGYGG